VALNWQVIFAGFRHLFAIVVDVSAFEVVSDVVEFDYTNVTNLRIVREVVLACAGLDAAAIAVAHGEIERIGKLHVAQRAWIRDLYTHPFGLLDLLLESFEDALLVGIRELKVVLLKICLKRRVIASCARCEGCANRSRHGKELPARTRWSSLGTGELGLLAVAVSAAVASSISPRAFVGGHSLSCEGYFSVSPPP